MSDLDKALSDIAGIRNRLAAATLFKGFGPAVVATSGALALALATAQTLWPDGLANTPETFLAAWIAIAGVAAGLIGVEMIGRSERRHGRLSTAMILNAMEQFLPASFAGATIAAVFLKYSPRVLWTLPGLWEILVALGIFAAARSLPRGVVLAATWYFVAGMATLVIGSVDQTLSPWMMGLPFGIGQFLLAAVLHLAEGTGDEE
jgi:hypothetical protein